MRTKIKKQKFIEQEYPKVAWRKEVKTYKAARIKQKAWRSKEWSVLALENRGISQTTLSAEKRKVKRNSD